MSQINSSDTASSEASGETRENVLYALREDLLGPVEPNEVIDQSPATRYLLGMLAPKHTPVPQEEDEQSEGDDEDEGGAARSTLALSPSSIGLSFLATPETKTVNVTAAWGEYFKVEPQTLEEDDEEEDGKATSKRRPRANFQRTPVTVTKEIDIVDTNESPLLLAAGVSLEWSSSLIAGFNVTTVFLTNNRESTGDSRPADEDWIYQPRLEITGDEAPFLSRTEFNRTPSDDPDIISADLLYRKQPEFAVGHGVAAGWEVDEAVSYRASKIWSDQMPESEVFPVTGPDKVPPISMDAIGAAEDFSTIRESIEPMLSAYESWIVDRKAEVNSLSDRFRPVAIDHLNAAKESLTRMRKGLGVFEFDPDALKAFSFANRTMALQRRASEKVLAKRRGDKVPTDGEIPADWRPFQMGFILQSISGLVNRDDSERNIIDLLWYPTGGGKTEAYLGLTSFTLAIRRLWGRRGDIDYSRGTAVLMRYTLRLLTIQQFQRALTLICACEIERVSDTQVWGDERFRIGLWVGQSVTPNSYDDSQEAIERLKAGEYVYSGSPVQLLNCPWCGSELKPENYIADRDAQRTTIKCFGDDCPFNPRDPHFGKDGIPALVVDQEIYRHPPSLLMATVDKFALMAWNGEVRNLFGLGEQHCSRHGLVSLDHAKTHRETHAYPAANTSPVLTSSAPIDLIIQDELHLISGPMGSVVGLYEGVIDGANAIEVDGAIQRPKIIASTATVRRARDQLHALYNRSADVFPASGIDADDSFFARVDRSQPGRRYVGVFGPGKSIKTTLVRTYSRLLTAAKTEFDLADTEENDSYMSLVGYFNSIRELGGALRLVEDDVPARVNVLRRRGLTDGRYLNHRELTSRRRTFEIASTLADLDLTFSDSGEGRRPIDILLASNMLSVGVDIDRLSLMVMSAQPKTTAEYIQATSRIGRRHPGLVIQVYNWVRPRDISHYERFRHYHQTFYRHVEATSVTPYSERARDRGLAGAFVSYVRQTVPGMSGYLTAGSIPSDSDQVEAIIDDLVNRAGSVTDSESVKNETRQQITNYLSAWKNWAAIEDADLVYGTYGPLPKAKKRKLGLLKPMDWEGAASRTGFATANSMREVESELKVVVSLNPLDAEEQK